MKDNYIMPDRKSKMEFTIALVIFAVISLWLFYLRSFDLAETEKARQIWGAVYQIMALFGGITGILVSMNWGGYKSLLGRAILFFAIGLLFQVLGQSVDSYYNIFQNQIIPYPALGDIGFFGSVIAYLYAVILLTQISGAKFSLKKARNKIWAILIPLAALIISYAFFLRGYEFDWSSPIRIFLDFGYPFGEALYVSVGILALLMSRDYLGGIMKRPILFLIFALIIQYCAEFMFLYQASHETWYVGGINDFTYFLSYSAMTCALVYLGSVFGKIKNS